MTDFTAIANVCARINQRTRDPRLVLVPGLADDLRSIGEAFIALTRVAQLLARAELARQGSYALSKSDYHDLVALVGPCECPMGEPFQPHCPHHGGKRG